MNIYFPFEGQARELNARIHFSIEAAKRGHNAYFGQKINLYPLLPRLKPGIFFLKSVQLRNAKLIEKLKKIGHFSAAIDEEGIMRICDEIYFGYRLSKKCLNLLDAFFSWGDDHSESIINYYPDLAEKVYSAGNSRIDILKSINKSDERVSKLKSKYGSFLLFASKFARCNGLNYEKTFADAIKSNFNSMSDNVYQALLDNESWERDNMFSYMEAIKKCAKFFNDKTIIIRPHPSEDFSTWHNFVNKLGLHNVIINSDGNSIIPWILAAEKIISHNCTTAVESAFLGIKTINYTAFPDENFEYKLPLICSDTARNIDELKSLILKKQNFQFDFNKVKFFIKNSGDKSFCDYSMEIIENKVNSLYYSEKNKVLNRFNLFFAKLWHNFRVNFSLFLGSGRDKRIYFTQKFKGFKIDYVENIIKSFSAQNDVHVIEAWPGVYKISKKK